MLPNFNLFATLYSTVHHPSCFFCHSVRNNCAFFAKPIDVYYMLCYNNFIRSIRCECMGVLRKYLLSLYRRKCLKYHKILYDVKLIKSLQITRWGQIKRRKLQNPPKISLKLTKCPRKIPCKNSLWEILLLQFSII